MAPIQNPNTDPREGWEEDSRRLGELGLSDEDREWLEADLGDTSEQALGPDWTDEEIAALEASLDQTPNDQREVIGE